MKEEFKFEYCAYCNAEFCLPAGEEIPQPPQVDDEKGWAAQARTHGKGCEWIESRAFQREKEEKNEDE